MSTLIIAEPGGTGEGDYDTMVHLLETAHTCGATVWKPQYASNAEQHLARRSQHLSAVERRVFLARYRRAYHWLQWPVEWHADFRDRCHALGMFYACSVCLPEDVAVVAPFVDYLKISSFESGDKAMWTAYEQLDALRPKMIASYQGGMVPQYFGFDVLQLHCVAAYPAPVSALNLAVLRSVFFDGLSDHSRDVRVGAWAVCAGARIMEAHYRLHECDVSNPDFPVAFTPFDFTAYIRNIREAEEALGDGISRRQPCEIQMAKLQIR